MKTNPFAQHELALKVWARRHEVLSANIANADTPNYKARDIDFASILRGAGGGGLPLATTSGLHQESRPGTGAAGSPAWRVPVQAALDGNTVEADVEQAQFADNALRYRASLTFLNGTIKTLRYALKGSD